MAKTAAKRFGSATGALVACTLVAGVLVAGAGLAGCSGKASGLLGGTHDDETEDPVQIPNPWRYCATLDGAADIAGFAMTAPEQVMGKDVAFIQAVQDSTIQVFFGDEGDRVLIRKGVGEGDISGDYNSYDVTQIITVGETPVTMKGNGEGLYSTVVWTAGGYSYAILLDTPAIVDTIIDLVWHIS